MYEEQDFDTLEETQKSKNTVKIIVIIAVVVVLAVVGILFYTLYNGDDEEISGELSEVASNVSVENSVAETSDDLSEDASEVSQENVSSEILQSSQEQQSSENADFSEASEESTVSEEVSAEPEHGWVINAMGYTYLYQGKGYNQFNGTKALAEKYAATINKLSASVPFPVYSMIAPTGVEFVDIPYDVKQSDDFYNSSQKNYIANVNSALSANGIDIYSSIAAKVSEEYLYLRTDKNWTADAAYLAYVDFCNATGNIPASKAAYELGSYTGYLGNFYNATNSLKLKENADIVNFYKINAVFPCTVTMYNGDLAYKDRALIYSQLSNPTSFAYYAFLGDRGERFVINSQNSATEKSVLVVGDSSAFAFVPFLAANYRNIYFINAETYKGTISSFIADKTIDEAMVLSYASSTATNSYVNRIDSMVQASEN